MRLGPSQLNPIGLPEAEISYGLETLAILGLDVGIVDGAKEVYESSDFICVRVRGLNRKLLQ